VLKLNNEESEFSQVLVRASNSSAVKCNTFDYLLRSNGLMVLPFRSKLAFIFPTTFTAAFECHAKYIFLQVMER